MAAASGSAQYIKESDSGGYGNLVKVTHDNGYQTWYGHLQPQNQPISGHVGKADPIGLVGMSGNSSGPHIHFTVLKDVNGNKNFNDDKPYGFVDPLGWEGKYVDPWTEYKAGNTSGSASFKLFTNLSKPVEQFVPKTGGEISYKNLKLTVSPDTLSLDFTVHVKDGPFEHIELSNKRLSSVAPSFFLEAFNSLGDRITEFLKPITFIYSYSDSDLSNVKEGTLKMYYYDISEKKWIPVDSVVDLDKKIIIAKIAHFTQFAVMGEAKDNISPNTEVVIHGNKGPDSWYSSDVGIELKGMDNEGGLGLLYTLFSLDEDLWEKYNNQLNFSSEGTHKIYYQSFDKADNKEERKTVSFQIDKTSPSTTAKITGTKGSNGWYTSNVVVELSASDNASGIARTKYSTDNGQTYSDYSNQFSISAGGVSVIKYYSEDKAGNIEQVHSLELKIDKTPPSTIVYITGTKGQNNWYKTDAQIAFNVKDDSSGFQKTLYSLNNGQSYLNYSDPLTFMQEGPVKIIYYSVDNAGNEEQKKIIEFNIDKTPPEALISYDLAKFDITVVGKDSVGGSGQTSVSVSKTFPLGQLFTLTDLAGNTLKINTDVVKSLKQVVMTIKSLQYNNNTSINLDRNLFFTNVVTDAKSKIIVLQQYFSDKGTQQVLSNYLSPLNTTQISTVSSFGAVKNENKPGTVLIYLTTDNGKLKYSY